MQLDVVKIRNHCALPYQAANSAGDLEPETQTSPSGGRKERELGSGRGRLLIADDEANARTALADILRDEGYWVETAADGFKALPKLEEFAPDVLLTDLRMPGMDGIDLMRKARDIDPEIACVVMTAYGGVETAVAAMRQGAVDYLLKPINVEELAIVIERVLERRRLRRETHELRARLADRSRVQSLVGSSPPMQRVYETLLQVAPSRASVLITGESGTGKELIAAAIHQHSPRAAQPFVKLHCAALAEGLLESELFGHEKGAFTGALARRDGRFHQANGGTLFLDEIADISPLVQVKLLRFLQEREFERVGGNQTIHVDVRIVAATNADLEKLVKEGKFREDLFYRLNVVSIEVPPLRARSTDIALLAMHFLNRYAKENGKSIEGFSDDALSQIANYHWPGNVRELENAIERAVVICRGNQLERRDLPASTAQLRGRTVDGMPVVPGATLFELEKFAILRTLEYTGGSTSRAAEMLGISPRKIQYRLHEYSGKNRQRDEASETSDADGASE